MLNTLVLPDRPTEDNTLVGVISGFFQRATANANRLRRHQDAFGVEAIEKQLEAASLFTDPVFLRHFQAVDKDRIRIDGVATHFVDGRYLYSTTIKIRIEQGHAIRGFLALLEGRSASQQQDFIRLLSG